MKRSTTVMVVVGTLVLACVGLSCLFGGLGYLIYQSTHARPFAVSDAGALETTPFVDAAGDFRIRIPRGWSVDKDTSTENLILWESPEVDTVGTREFRPNINVINNVPFSSSYDEDVIRRHRADHPDFNLLSDRRVSIHGRACHILDYTYIAKTGWPIHIQQTIIPAGATIYIVTATSHASTWEAHRKVLESSLATFEALR